MDGTQTRSTRPVRRRSVTPILSFQFGLTSISLPRLPTNVPSDWEGFCPGLLPPDAAWCASIRKVRLLNFPRGFGRRGDAFEALIPLRTVIRLVEKGLVTIQTNSTNGIITARITKRGRYIVEQMRGAVSLASHLRESE